ncbi:MAG: hypothetical protein KDA75_09345 [Planctomycetaceae bacterium]|nr:hypothetical protein [Planctomycetaceae bacterium]
MRNYVRQFVLFLALYLTGAAVVNVCVDPERIFGLVEWSWLSPYKVSALDPAGKAEIAHRDPPDVALIGDSRTMIGFDPQHPLLTRFGRSENLAFAGANPEEAARMLELLIESCPPKLVLWGLDAEGFAALERPRWEPRALETRLNPDLDLWSYYRRHLFGLPALQASYQAIRRGLFRRHVPWTNHGQKIDWEARPTGAHRANENTLRHRVQGRTNLPTDAPTGIEFVEPLLRRAQQAGTRLVLFLPPAHALFHDANYRQADRRRYAERCLTDLVVTVAAINRERPDGPAIEVWDFTGFTSWHTEAFPESVESDSLKWHWDAVHFQDSLGSLALKRMLGEERTQGSFGTRLLPSTLPTHLANWSRQRIEYERTHPRQAGVLSAWEQAITR